MNLKRITLWYILLILLVTLSCNTRKKNVNEVKETVKTEYTDTGRIVTIRSIEYVPYYDTITKKVFIYPRRLNERIEEKKGITAKVEKVYITKTKFIEKKPAFNKWITLGIFILIVILLLWYFVRKFTMF